MIHLIFIRRQIFLFFVVVLLVFGCTDESNNTQTNNENKYEFETAEELAAIGITITKVGSPIWQPTEFKKFSAKMGNAGNGFADFLNTSQCYYSAGQTGKNFFTADSIVYVPEREHPTDYFTFNTESVKACNFSDKTTTTFNAGDFTDPNGIFYVFQLVPIDGLAPVGKSPYKDQELVIPHSKFPLTVNGGLFKNNIELDSNFDGTLPALNTLKYPNSNDPIPGDGYPHFPLLFGDAYDFVKDKLPESEINGEYVFTVELRDAEQAGWTVTIKYTVE